MDRASLAELFRQVWKGGDIPAPDSLLRNITPEAAAIRLTSMPYSILTNLEHADFWQRIWLNRLQGRRAESFVKDWRVPETAEWPAIRASFLANLQAATDLASAEPFEHRMKSDEAAVRTLVSLAMHTIYHLGQVKLLKRQVRLTKGGEDAGKV